MFEEKHKEALIEKENIAKQLEKQQRHAAELQEDHQLEIDLRERRLREAKVAEEEARTLAEKARLEGLRKEEEMEAKEGKWLVGLVGLVGRCATTVIDLVVHCCIHCCCRFLFSRITF